MRDYLTCSTESSYIKHFTAFQIQKNCILTTRFDFFFRSVQNEFHLQYGQFKHWLGKSKCKCSKQWLVFEMCRVRLLHLYWRPFWRSGSHPRSSLLASHTCHLFCLHRLRSYRKSHHSFHYGHSWPQKQDGNQYFSHILDGKSQHHHFESNLIIMQGRRKV